MIRKNQLAGRFWEAFIKASGWASSILVVLIVIFLFGESLGLFSRPAVQEGLLVGVHPDNPVEELSSEDFRAFTKADEQPNWQRAGGPDAPVELLHISNMAGRLKQMGILTQAPEEQFGPKLKGLKPVLDSLLQARPNLLLVFTETYMPARAKEIPVGSVGVWNFLAGADWEPAESPAPAFGALPLLWGTILVTLGAMLFSLLLGPPVAVYLAEIAGQRVSGVLKPMVEMLAGIPSVVFGFLGLVIVVPWIRATFDLPTGSTALAGSLILAVVALPTIISVSEDAIRGTPRNLKDASLALGATHWQTIRSVSLPYARPGMLAAGILGIGRIVGETMVVLMVTGNNPQLVGFDFLAPVQTMSASVAAEMGEAPQGGLHYQSLFAVGSLLFLLTFCINLLGEWIKRRTGRG